MGWVWGLGAAGIPAAETGSPGLSPGQPEPVGEKAGRSFQNTVLSKPLSPTTSGAALCPWSASLCPTGPRLLIRNTGLLRLQLHEKQEVKPLSTWGGGDNARGCL